MTVDSSLLGKGNTMPPMNGNSKAATQYSIPLPQIFPSCEKGFTTIIILPPAFLEG